MSFSLLLLLPHNFHVSSSCCMRKFRLAFNARCVWIVNRERNNPKLPNLCLMPSWFEIAQFDRFFDCYSRGARVLEFIFLPFFIIEWMKWLCVYSILFVITRVVRAREEINAISLLKGKCCAVHNKKKTDFNWVEFHSNKFFSSARPFYSAKWWRWLELRRVWSRCWSAQLQLIYFSILYAREDYSKSVHTSSSSSNQTSSLSNGARSGTWGTTFEIFFLFIYRRETTEWDRRTDGFIGEELRKEMVERKGKLQSN